MILFSGCKNEDSNQNNSIEDSLSAELETVTEINDEVIDMEIPFENESTLNISENADIILSVKSAKSNCLELEICNKSSDTVFFSSWFIIEKKQDGKWIQQHIKPQEEIVWIDSLGFIEPEKTAFINENWNNKYPDISENCDYRIVKSFFFDERIPDEKIYVACEFRSEKTD